MEGTGWVTAITQEGGATLIRFGASPEVMSYVVEKGFIAVDGISLTIMAKDASSFQVSVVDFTLKHTTLGSRRVGDRINLEVDIIAKYVEQFSQLDRSSITINFLQEHGFLVG